jgi:hypothetical protein
MLGVFSQTASAGNATDEYVACVQACREKWGYKGNWHDLMNIELQLCYQECNIEYLNNLAKSGAELNKWAPKITINLGMACFQYTPGETIPLTVGRWENPNYPGNWTIDGYFINSLDHFLSDPGDIQSVIFEYSTDPTVGWTTIGSTSTFEEGFWTVDWVTPSVTEAYFVRAIMYSASLGDLDGDLAAFSQAFVFGGACFIATAAYGTPMAPQIDVLRDFRDQYLLTNPVGKALVDFYYKVSPPMAEFITKHPALKPVVRAALVPAVALSHVAVNSTSAEKMAILGSLALVCIALAVWVRQRARRPGRGR